MNYWMIVVGIWMMFAFCVVLFIRGAQVRDPAIGRKAETPADSDGADAFALGRARSYRAD
jgi:hypothetical protein